MLASRRHDHYRPRLQLRLPYLQAVQPALASALVLHCLHRLVPALVFPLPHLAVPASRHLHHFHLQQVLVLACRLQHREVRHYLPPQALARQQAYQQV